jgi:hypothetical protein
MKITHKTTVCIRYNAQYSGFEKVAYFFKSFDFP